MACMKGITPIISIIVLLLIAVALAGAAWTYISGFTSAYTSKVIDLPPGSSYFDGENINIMLRNIGTSAISTGSCSVSGQNNNTVTCGDITITREGSAYDVDIRPGASSISPKGSITITDYNCQAGNVKYIISSPTSTYQVNVNADTPCSYPTDPVSWWKFDGDAKDSTGSNDGTAYGGANLNYVDGTRGKVVGFDGVDDYADCGSIATVPQNGPATIEGWFNFNQFAMAKGVSIDIHTQLYQHPANNHFYLGGGGADFFSVGATLSLNSWYHIALTYSGTHETALLYVNGVKYNVVIQSPNTNHASLSPFRISNTNFGGLIDDVMIFKRALSPEEIKALYNSQKK